MQYRVGAIYVQNNNNILILFSINKTIRLFGFIGMLYLQELAKQGVQQEQLTVAERLPHFIVAPCQLEVVYNVEAKEDFYLIHLKVQGALTCICQRCLHEVQLSYENPTTIAVARNDERAEQLLGQYECVVSSNWQVNLDDLVADDLHLYAPQFHLETKDCDQEINEFLIRNEESY